MQTHYFIAISLPHETKNQLAQFYAEVERMFPFQKPVAAVDYHITLAFLGNQEDELKLQQLMQAIAQKTEDVAPFQLTIDGYGTFGNSQSPRIFWNHLQHEQALFNVQQLVANACNDSNIPLETRPYNPHITIARKWAGEDDFNSDKLNSVNPLQQSPITFLAEEIVLYKTNLTTIPRYENIYSIQLKKIHGPLM